MFSVEADAGGDVAGLSVGGDANPDGGGAAFFAFVFAEYEFDGSGGHFWPTTALGKTFGKTKYVILVHRVNAVKCKNGRYEAILIDWDEMGSNEKHDFESRRAHKSKSLFCNNFLDKTKLLSGR